MPQVSNASAHARSVPRDLANGVAAGRCRGASGHRNCNAPAIPSPAECLIIDRPRTGLEEPPRLDPITTALQLAFYFLFTVSVCEFCRRRGQLEPSVVAIFGSIAALFTLTFVNALVPVVAPVA